MIIEYIRYDIPAPDHDRFVAAYTSAAAELDAAGECLAYEMSQGDEEPNNFIIRIEWTSREAHEQDFRKGAHFAAFFAKVKPFYGNIREMKHYRAFARRDKSVEPK